MRACACGKEREVCDMTEIVKIKCCIKLRYICRSRTPGMQRILKWLESIWSREGKKDKNKNKETYLTSMYVCMYDWGIVILIW